MGEGLQLASVRLHIILWLRNTNKFSNLDFLATQPPEFTETTGPLEVNNWLPLTE
jgi:hypothetical protein